MEYASNGKGNLGVTLGAIGTGLSVLNGGLGMIGTGSWGNNYHNTDGGRYITKDELDYVQTIAAKDSEIALLKSEQNTEVKIADVYERLITRINADKNAQQQINSEQAVWNGVNTATLGCMQNNIAQLMSLTQLKIPNTSVCPGWGAVSVTPASTGTTVA